MRAPGARQIPASTLALCTFILRITVLLFASTLGGTQLLWAQQVQVGQYELLYTIEGTTQHWGGLLDFDVSGEGRVLIADDQGPSVQLWDQGRLVWTHDSEGEGPGEIRSVNSAQFLGSGRVAILDGRQGRLVIVDEASGEVRDAVHDQNLTGESLSMSAAGERLHFLRQVFSESDFDPVGVTLSTFTITDETWAVREIREWSACMMQCAWGVLGSDELLTSETNDPERPNEDPRLLLIKAGREGIGWLPDRSNSRPLNSVANGLAVSQHLYESVRSSTGQEIPELLASRSDPTTGGRLQMTPGQSTMGVTYAPGGELDIVYLAGGA